ncbi:MAG: alpha/beta hydrolase [Hyphomicrobium sp.]
MPIVIIAGAKDKLIDTDSQSKRLHAEIPQSRFHKLAENGHMIQQTSMEQVMGAIMARSARSAASSARR